MDSWSGPSGHRKGDVYVFDVFGEMKTWCRKLNLRCNGLKTCEFFDFNLLEGVQRYEADDSINKIFSRRLDQNEAGDCGTQAASLLAR
jgi:hypothetical protein